MTPLRTFVPCSHALTARVQVRVQHGEAEQQAASLTWREWSTRASAVHAAGVLLCARVRGFAKGRARGGFSCLKPLRP